MIENDNEWQDIKYNGIAMHFEQDDFISNWKILFKFPNDYARTEYRHNRSATVFNFIMRQTNNLEFILSGDLIWFFPWADHNHVYCESYPSKHSTNYRIAVPFSKFH